MQRNDPGMSRRSFLRRATVVSLGTIAAGSVAPTVTRAETSAIAQADPAPAMPPHGAELRGMSLVVNNPQAEGRFGFMFKGQTPLRLADDQAQLFRDLGSAMHEPFSSPTDSIDENDKYDENPNSLLTSGVTFVGQFIDHDITFDTTPIDLQLADPDATSSFRTPRYDLDSVYGLGPVSNPQFYDPKDPVKFLIPSRTYSGPINTNNGPITVGAGSVPAITVEDVPRDSTGKAIIADGRNDQHVMIAQIHVAFMKFHNKLVDYVRSLRVPSASVFESARRLARWHYQWIIIHDYLPRIVGQATADAVYKDVAGGAPSINIKYYKPANPNDRAFMPVEYSVAAFRFGHSITRPRYTIQDIKDNTGKVLGSVKAVPLFGDSPTDNNLNGSREIPARLKLQWSKFFNAPGTWTARPVRQIDARLSASLFSLPPTAIPDGVYSENLLAVRNLLRGRKLGLPSGQTIARLMGVTPLTASQIATKHTVVLDITKNPMPVVQEYDEPDTEIAAVIQNAAWNGEVPLWFYILKEAESIGKTRQLGPVGGRIVAEVLVGLLQRDQNSYLYLNPSWKPSLPAATPGTFTMVDLLKYVGMWS
jgi:hypothetical protein